MQNASFASVWLKLGAKVDLHVKVAFILLTHIFPILFFCMNGVDLKIKSQTDLFSGLSIIIMTHIRNKLMLALA